jgi:hypothetical protein
MAYDTLFMDKMARKLPHVCPLVDVAGEPLTPMTPHTGTDMWEDSQVRSNSHINTAR